MTGIPLRALLTHRSCADVRVLSGSGEDRLLTGSLVLRDIRSDPKDVTGCLLVVMYAADRNDWHLDALLNRAASGGAAALVLEGEEPLLSSTAALARRLRLSVLGAPAPWIVHETFLRLNGAGEVELADTVLRAIDAVGRTGPEVDDALDAFSRGVGRPVSLLDGQGSVIAGDGVAPVPAELARRLGTGAPTARCDLDGGGVVLAHAVAVAGTRAWLAVRTPARLPGRQRRWRPRSPR